jgi:hypothetical protein
MQGVRRKMQFVRGQMCGVSRQTPVPEVSIAIADEHAGSRLFDPRSRRALVSGVTMSVDNEIGSSSLARFRQALLRRVLVSVADVRSRLLDLASPRATVSGLGMGLDNDIGSSSFSPISHMPLREVSELVATVISRLWDRRGGQLILSGVRILGANDIDLLFLVSLECTSPTGVGTSADDDISSPILTLFGAVPRLGVTTFVAAAAAVWEIVIGD